MNLLWSRVSKPKTDKMEETNSKQKTEGWFWKDFLRQCYIEQWYRGEDREKFLAASTKTNFI